MLIARSIYIITEYYQNNLQPYYENLAEDVMWIGPAEGQELRGRENIIATFSAEQHALRFEMGIIRSSYVMPHRGVYEILLEYEIHTLYPSGNVDVHRQRLHYTWSERRVRTTKGNEHIWEITMLHISNAWQYDKRDRIYPTHYENMGVPARLSGRMTRYLVVKDEFGQFCRIPTDRLLYIETIKRSSKLRVHTDTEEIVISGSLPQLEQEWSEDLLRIHASYMVNPNAVSKIERFGITLTDGTRLPVPEKKYTQVKRRILEGK